jgi:cellulose synthase operon protein C
MKIIASAKLLGTTPGPGTRALECQLELIELDLPHGQKARYVVHLRQGELENGVMLAATESALTAAPTGLDDAKQRALDFIRRRLQAKEQLVQHEGFEGLANIAAPLLAVQAAPPLAETNTIRLDIKALISRFQPDRWKLLTPEKKSRSVWRLAEVSDTAHLQTQATLLKLVPQLVRWLESDTDLLDHSLAVALGRLGDAGSAQAMQHLSERGRSAHTQRAASQAWWMLQTPEQKRSHGATFSADAQAMLNAPINDSQRFLQTYRWVQVNPESHAKWFTMIKTWPLQHDHFESLRHLYKAAEMARDMALLALLHARFENTPAQMRTFGQPKAFGPRTRNYLRLRGWRQLRRMAALEHSQAPELAVQMLLALNDADAPKMKVLTPAYGRHHHVDVSSAWLLVGHLLLVRHPDVRFTAGHLHWHSTSPIHTHTAFENRTEALSDMWDAHPQALVQVLLGSQAAIVHAVLARALQDHQVFLQSQSKNVLQALLQSRYAPTSHVTFLAVQSLVTHSRVFAEQLVWIKCLLQSSSDEAQTFALQHMAAHPALYVEQPEVIAMLLLSSHEQARQQGAGLCALANPQALVAELQNALLAVADNTPGLAQSTAHLATVLQTTLLDAARTSPVEPLLCLLQHPSHAVLELAVTWLLVHKLGVAMVAPQQLTELLQSQDLARRACGVRLLGAMPDAVLLAQAPLLHSLATHASTPIRNAIEPALLRLSGQDAHFAKALAQHLHASLFASEAGEGAHEDALRWLTQHLTPSAPALEAQSLWRALQARSTGAQRYGAWGLPHIAPEAYSIKQQSVLCQHADVSVRAWGMNAITSTLGPNPTPEQAAQLLPLASTQFDDARSFAQTLFATKLPDTSLSTELLIAWIDHPAAWVQTLGRQRLVRQMNAQEASLCLTRLSQHPSPAVKLFVTQWLLEMPLDNPDAVATQLRSLQPYFITVLSQVHRGRTAKSRVTEFLRALVQQPQTQTKTAQVVADIFARQVVTSSLTDKPQYIAALRDIAQRHPSIELPFVQWQPIEVQAS